MTFGFSRSKWKPSHVLFKRHSRTDVFVNYDLIHRFLTEELKAEMMKAPCDLICLTLTIHTIATRADLKKYGILKNLRNNKNIVILHPDKRSGVVIMDKITYKSKMYELLNDESKFKQLTSDPTKLREGRLQRYLRKLNNKGYFDEAIYNYIYPAGSLHSILYGGPKIQLRKPLRHIVLSINS